MLAFGSSFVLEKKSYNITKLYHEGFKDRKGKNHVGVGSIVIQFDLVKKSYSREERSQFFKLCNRHLIPI